MSHGKEVALIVDIEKIANEAEESRLFTALSTQHVTRVRLNELGSVRLCSLNALMNLEVIEDSMHTRICPGDTITLPNLKRALISYYYNGSDKDYEAARSYFDSLFGYLKGFSTGSFRIDLFWGYVLVEGNQITIDASSGILEPAFVESLQKMMPDMTYVPLQEHHLITKQEKQLVREADFGPLTEEFRRIIESGVGSHWMVQQMMWVYVHHHKLIRPGYYGVKFDELMSRHFASSERRNGKEGWDTREDLIKACRQLNCRGLDRYDFPAPLPKEDYERLQQLIEEHVGSS